MPKWDRYTHALPSEDPNNGWSYPGGKTEKQVFEELRRSLGSRKYELGPSAERTWTKENDYEWAFDKETREWIRIAPFQNYDPVTRIVHYYGYRTWNCGDGGGWKPLSPEKDGVTWCRNKNKSH